MPSRGVARDRAPDGESVFINADPTLLDEMLRNVIENGVKYNRLNGEVQVEVSRLADGARVRVTDTGIGIPQEHQDKVFERFYRVDGSRSKQTGRHGSGPVDCEAWRGIPPCQS